jgi:hypothetical protein
MKIGIKKTVEVEAKVLKIHAKCSDCCSATLVDQDGKTITENDGYVPDFMPGDHYGDYVILDIDLETGQILNWKKPSLEDVQSFVRKCEGEEE